MPNLDEERLHEPHNSSAAALTMTREVVFVAWSLCLRGLCKNGEEDRRQTGAIWFLKWEDMTDANSCAQLKGAEHYDGI